MRLLECEKENWVNKEKILGVKVEGFKVTVLVEGGFAVVHSTHKTEREADTALKVLVEELDESVKEKYLK